MSRRMIHGEKLSSMVPVVITALLLAGSKDPQNLADVVAKAKDPSPRTYHFECVYSMINAKGEIMNRRRYTGDCTTDVPKGRIRWSGASLATASGAEGAYGTDKPFDFMEGIEYSWQEASEVGKSAAFAKIPPMAVECRNLLWDTHMFEHFAHAHLGKLRLNDPLVIRKNQDADLAGSGNFHDHAIDLTWIGTGKWNGVDCALIRYRAFFNRFDYAMGNLKTVGSSDYWGEIWLAKRTNRIEYATLYEAVSTVLGNSAAPMRVFRVGTYEHVKR